MYKPSFPKKAAAPIISTEAFWFASNFPKWYPWGWPLPFCSVPRKANHNTPKQTWFVVIFGEGICFTAKQIFFTKFEKCWDLFSVLDLYSSFFSSYFFFLTFLNLWLHIFLFHRAWSLPNFLKKKKKSPCLCLSSLMREGNNKDNNKMKTCRPLCWKESSSAGLRLAGVAGLSQVQPLE